MHRSFPACWSQDDKALKILRGVAEHYKLPMLNYESQIFFKLNREIKLMFVGDSKWRCVWTFSGFFHDQMSLDHPKGYRIVNKWWLFLVGGQKPTWLGIMYWPMGIIWMGMNNHKSQLFVGLKHRTFLIRAWHGSARSVEHGNDVAKSHRPYIKHPPSPNTMV